ncbi:glycosyltransferase [Xylariales sp. PMI_506]|nr:glycosyltransferase [Xylariales sp. PMI_506]
MTASQVDDPTILQLDNVSIPPGTRLIPSDKLDRRSDEEIAAWLQARHPITSDKNVWAFWHSGYRKMPPWVQRNIINWVRRLGPEWTVHLLNRVDESETNVYHYLEPSFFPDAFNEGTMNGRHMGPHQADLIRLPLLWKYGGVWIDAGTFLFRHVDDICWKQIEDPASPYEMAGFVIEMQSGEDAMLNGFIATKRNNMFIKYWHDIFLSLWKGATNSHDFHKHPLINHLPLLYPPFDKINCPVLNVSAEQFTDYLTHFMCFERLRKLVDPEAGFNGPEYYANKMLLTPALQETWYHEQVTGFDGKRQFEMLTSKRSGDGVVKDETWQAAEDFVNATLANSSTMKLSHGHPDGLESCLAGFWDMKEHEDKDNVEGTFAAYLRYGSVHFDQTRELVPLKYELVTEGVLTCGILEPKRH